MPVIVSGYCPGSQSLWRTNKGVLEVVGFVPQIAVTPAGQSGDRQRDIAAKAVLSRHINIGRTGTPLTQAQGCWLIPKLNDGAITFSVIEDEELNAPDTPVIVTVLCPIGAVLLAVNITVDVFVVGLVENVAGDSSRQVCCGKVHAAREAILLKPHRHSLKSYCPVLRIAARLVISKNFGPVIESLSVVVAVKLPEVPVMVSVAGTARHGGIRGQSEMCWFRWLWSARTKRSHRSAIRRSTRFTLPVNPYSGNT